jgi:hypothetical protein
MLELNLEEAGHVTPRCVARRVGEYMSGACGDLSRDEIVDHIANELVDYVIEALAEVYGVGAGSWYDEPCPIQIPWEAYAPIRRILAAALVAQFETDELMWRDTARRIHEANVRPEPQQAAGH